MNFTHKDGKKVFKNFTEDITDKYFPDLNNFGDTDLNNDFEDE